MQITGLDQQAKLNKLVLVVDDEERIARFIRVSLSLSGYDVVTAGSGEDALELLKSIKPDIVLLDVFMPDIDGFAVLQHIRACKKCGRVPVIIFSARNSLAEKAMSLGANDFMTKPFRPDELAMRIAGILNHTS